MSERLDPQLFSGLMTAMDAEEGNYAYEPPFVWTTLLDVNAVERDDKTNTMTLTRIGRQLLGDEIHGEHRKGQE